MRENDRKGDTHAQVLCPICEDEIGLCSHLLAQLDVTQGEMLGGKFFRHEGQAFEALNDAIKIFLKSIQSKPVEEVESLLTTIGIPRLATLARAAKEETANSLGDEGAAMCYGDFLDYLDDLFRDFPDVATVQHDLEGDLGACSLCESYWCEDTDACVEMALQRIKKDVEVLRRLKAK
jgi:hypothetical protein